MYMCVRFLFKNLNLGPYLPYSTNIYICEMIIASSFSLIEVYGAVWIQRFPLNPSCVFPSFFFYHFLLTSRVLGTISNVAHCSSIVAALFITAHALKNIKNRSHDTIHTFKYYFATALSAFSF